MLQLMKKYLVVIQKMYSKQSVEHWTQMILFFFILLEPEKSSLLILIIILSDNIIYLDISYLSFLVVVSGTKQLNPRRQDYVTVQSILAVFEPSNARIPNVHVKSKDSSAARVESAIAARRNTS